MKIYAVSQPTAKTIIFLLDSLTDIATRVNSGEPAIS